MELANTANEALPWVASLPPECWSAVGNQIRSPQTLRALISTCRAFHNIFKPFLYRNWRLDPLEFSPQEIEFQACYPSRFFRYTKHLQLSIGTFNSSWCRGDMFIESKGMMYAASIMKFLTETMKSIRSFRWVVLVDHVTAARMLRVWEVVKALKQSETIKHITLRIAKQWLYDRQPAISCTVPLKGFRNLSSLELYHFFYDDKERVLEDIASTLADSPYLQTLGLGMACNFKVYNSPDVLWVEDELDFFERLCMEYGSQASAAPLPLKSLKLGHGMFILRSQPTVTSSHSNYLAKLVKASGLKTLHIFNGLFTMNIEDNPQALQVEWSFFECTSLHQLSVTMLGNDVREWLNTVSTSVQELIVTHHYGKWDPDLRNFNALKLPNLTMLFTPENFLLEPDTREGSSDIASPGSQDSFGSEDALDFELSDRQTNLTPENTRSLEFWTNATVLDRLHDGGSKLSELYLDIRFETQWIQFSAHLSKMHHLTQLRIGSGLSKRDIEELCLYPAKSSLWPGVLNTHDIAFNYAQLIKSLCPSLHYVRIHHWTWEFVILNFEPSPPWYTIREMENDELICMDILSFDRFSDRQAGLPFQEDL